MTRRETVLLLSILLWMPLGLAGTASCETPNAAPADADARPRVILISLDGTRPVDVDEDKLPSLVALARAGARADALQPVDPSNTFPSHVSLATGVRPEVHRLVNNAFEDPIRGRFGRRAPNEWIEAEPIWSVAERAGVPAASFYWVGSEGPWSGGPGPRDTRERFSARTTEKTKVTQILEWLTTGEPEARPRLITCWFHGADHEGHEYGPDSPEVVAALRPQDEQIARLVAGLEAHGLFESTTLIFVSDHGMVEASERVNLSRLLRRARLDLEVIGIGGFSSLVFDDDAGSPAEVARAVAIAREAGLDAWPREQAPADWHVDDPRFGHVVVRAPIGTAIVGATTLIDGFHGYDSREPAMAGLLVARGRGVEPGTELGRVSSLAVAPTVLTLLGLPVPEAMSEPPIEGLLRGLAGRGHAAAQGEGP